MSDAVIAVNFKDMPVDDERARRRRGSLPRARRGVPRADARGGHAHARRRGPRRSGPRDGPVDRARHARRGAGARPRRRSPARHAAPAAAALARQAHLRAPARRRSAKNPQAEPQRASRRLGSADDQLELQREHEAPCDAQAPAQKGLRRRERAVVQRAPGRRRRARAAGRRPARARAAPRTAPPSTCSRKLPPPSPIRSNWSVAVGVAEPLAALGIGGDHLGQPAREELERIDLVRRDRRPACAESTRRRPRRYRRELAQGAAGVRRRARGDRLGRPDRHDAAAARARPPGPTSITWSASRITSRLCSTTSTLPPALEQLLEAVEQHLHLAGVEARWWARRARRASGPASRRARAPRACAAARRPRASRAAARA